jgi:mono/diheme cytochrome c family protein
VLASIDRVLAWLTAAAAVFAVVVLIAGPDLIGAKKQAGATSGAATSGAPAATTTSGAQPASAAPDGKAVFASAGCGSCHTLAAAGATGNVGPNLDQLKPNLDTIKAVVSSGTGVMPSFQGRLSQAEIDAVAQFVATSTGG